MERPNGLRGPGRSGSRSGDSLVLVYRAANRRKGILQMTTPFPPPHIQGPTAIPTGVSLGKQIVSPPSRSRRRWYIGGGIVVVALLTGIGTQLALNGGDGPRTFVWASKFSINSEGGELSARIGGPCTDAETVANKLFHGAGRAVKGSDGTASITYPAADGGFAIHCDATGAFTGWEDAKFTNTTDSGHVRVGPAVSLGISLETFKIRLPASHAVPVPGGPTVYLDDESGVCFSFSTVPPVGKLFVMNTEGTTAFGISCPG